MTRSEHFSVRLTPRHLAKLDELSQRLDAPRGRVLTWLIDQAGDVVTPSFFATNPAAEVSEAQTAGFAHCNP